jgi:hypothetical protein
MEEFEKLVAESFQAELIPAEEAAGNSSAPTEEVAEPAIRSESAIEQE